VKWSWTVFWIVWLAMVAVGDVIAAVNKQRGDTLTEHVRKWCSLQGKGKLWRIRRLALALLLVYLVGHFFGGLW
jgi:hypothetical protein